MTGRHALCLAILLADAGARPAPQLSAFAREMLAAHNAVRARVGVWPLVWSQRLAGAAQAWSEKLASQGRFAHNPKSPYGENLFEISGGRTDAAEVVGGWAAGSADYDYYLNVCRGTCGQ